MTAQCATAFTVAHHPSFGATAQCATAFTVARRLHVFVIAMLRGPMGQRLTFCIKPTTALQAACS
eukprot:505379-Alexandrium_andersonii.AAC.1